MTVGAPFALAIALFAASAVQAQVAATEPAPAAAGAPAAAASAAAEGGPNSQRVEVTGGRPSDTEQRRQSTVSKIVIGRDEIERQGDSTLGEILKRLPGVTLGGAPGRGGAIRFRGLGTGYTQILLDGDRMPPGFSIDSLSPEQIASASRSCARPARRPARRDRRHHQHHHPRGLLAKAQRLQARRPVRK